jgi:hypothetical protein
MKDMLMSYDTMSGGKVGVPPWSTKFESEPF